jgi:hypothetical protein
MNSLFAISQKSKKDTVKTGTASTASLTSTDNKIKPVEMPIPEFINQPYYFDRDDNRLIRLENHTGKITTKKKTLGLQGAKQILSTDGGTSKVRFVSKNNITFLIKTNGDVNDLTTYVKLYKLTPTNDKREVTVNSKEGIIINNDDGKSTTVGFSVKMIAPENYMISFAEPLEAGEYAFVWVKNMDSQEFTLYAFGIDWRRSD